ncbi:histidine kinase [[Leptolyngbya] sp. PCC 7376]|uniref:sensor histidine kinase n=1 Tax=[Leptolyngbya] sp. PCC 7376 TaxID=111781 RepID=UPI00029F26F0|nr:HAMP domain-containing sensor histidine kinase [[Leptolyngbya] sp. PCC 7376]AFY40052.1 histidine kinase [[Leptolyngbya] sp. PCC 7376]
MNANFELNQIEISKTISSVLQDALGDDGNQSPMSAPQRRRQWRGAIAALELLLHEQNPQAQDAGMVLSSPSPMFCDRQISDFYQQVVFAPKSIQEVAIKTLMLTGIVDDCPSKSNHNFLEFPLFSNDPLYKERFCIVLTPKFSFVMVASEEGGFQFSFDPEVLSELWQMLRWRMALSQPFQFQTIQQLWQQFLPVAPDYKLVSRFSQVMLRSLPDINVVPTAAPKTHSTKEKSTVARDIQPELELLQALTHEIRTPLTTIRTMTKLLLKKKKQLTSDIVKRIETIEQECNEQIRRMELIFRAAELEAPSHCREVQLIPISLEQIFHHGIPFWEKQAQRRNVELKVLLPKTLPQVVSDPAMLDQVLSGLIETFTRRLPSGSEVEINVSTAGSQLKLEVQSQGIGQKCLEKAIGQMLIFQPETGSLSLNVNVTKNLFQALGGKLRIRQKPSGEDVFTIFLPLGNNVPLTI